MNTPMAMPPNSGRPLQSLRQRLLKGTLLKWTENTGWLDRDGVQPVEGPYLLWGLEEGYQRWQDQNVVDEIIDKPLPDLEQLNAAIPKNEWEFGLDNHPRPPWSHQYAVYLLDPRDGQVFTVMNSTVGMRMMWESLGERMEIMRRLRSTDVIGVVMLASRPFKTAKWGIKHRPDLKVTEWRNTGGGGSGALTGPASPPPQLPPTSTSSTPGNRAPETPSSSIAGPVSSLAPTPTSNAAPSRPQTHPTPPPPPPASPAPRKPAKEEREAGLAFLDPVEPVRASEELSDEIPW